MDLKKPPLLRILSKHRQIEGLARWVAARKDPPLAARVVSFQTDHPGGGRPAAPENGPAPPPGAPRARAPYIDLGALSPLAGAGQSA